MFGAFLRFETCSRERVDGGIRRAAPTLLASALVVGACAPIHGLTALAYRNGPDPDMPIETVEEAQRNEIAIMNAFLAVSRYEESRTPPWYAATIAGFNFVDRECDRFLQELYVLDHERQRVKASLTTGNSFVNAILGVAEKNTLPFVAVTQAFNLSSQWIDAYADSYLFSGHASTVRHVVDTMQAAYREKTVQDRDAIGSEPEAYQRIRGYLQLCLPATIESKIDKALSGSSGKTTAAVVAGELNKSATGEPSSAPPQIDLVLPQQ